MDRITDMIIIYAHMARSTSFTFYIYRVILTLENNMLHSYTVQLREKAVETKHLHMYHCNNIVKYNLP